MQQSSSSKPFRAVIIGGGVTGLTAARALTRARADIDVTLLEASHRLGGNICTERVDDFLLDTGPDSFLVTKPDALSLCRELGLENHLIETRPEARRVYFVYRGRLEPMPAGMTLSVPTRIAPMITTPLLSTPAKLRALLEPVVPKRHAPLPDAGASANDETIHDFFSRRFGREVAERLAGPLLGGVYAGDTSALSMEATFPQLLDLERRHGSLVKGFFSAAAANGGSQSLLRWLMRRRETSAPSPFKSLEYGMGMLIDVLAGELRPGLVRRSTPVSRVFRTNAGRWQVIAGDEVIDADAVLIAAPARVAAEIVVDEALARELAGVPYVSTATVFFAFRRADVAHPLDGLGFVAPPGEAQILAGTWISSKWNNRAPRDTVLMRAFVGGARKGAWVETAKDDDLVDLSCRELRRIMGPLEKPLWTRVFRYHRASPQPIVGHAERMRRIEDRLRALPALHIAGAGFDGVGIPDCIRQARAAARAILEESTKGDVRAATGAQDAAR